MLSKGSDMKKNNSQNLFGQNWSKIGPKMDQKWSQNANFRPIFVCFGGVQGAAVLGGIE